MEHHGTFGEDAFGRIAEHIARLFGTPQYICLLYTSDAADE